MFRLLNYRSSKVEESSTPDRADFSAARYEPMARLMSDDDLLFLKAQPGFRPEMGKKFSRERRRIFRLYLQELASDFHRLHAHARVVVSSLPADHAPLVGMLLRQQVRFWYEMTAVEMRLSLDLMGVGSIHARGLVEALSSMHMEIGRVALAGA
jgi:hypothetical protein